MNSVGHGFLSGLPLDDSISVLGVESAESEKSSTMVLVEGGSENCSVMALE